MSLAKKLNQVQKSLVEPVEVPQRVSARKVKTYASSPADVVAYVRKHQHDAQGSPVDVMDDADILSDVTEWIPTGFPWLDYNLGGGWPVGRVSEVYGKEASGKSALGHMAVRQNQIMGGTPVILDTETALDPMKMRQLRIKKGQTIYSVPRTMEDCWDVIWNLIDFYTKKPPEVPVLLLWDSIAATPTMSDLSRDAHEGSKVADQANVMTANCRQLLQAAAKVRMHIMFINQVRDNMQKVAWGEQDHTPCGNAIKFAASLRMRLSKVQTLGTSELKTGYKIQVKTDKNKIFPPHRKSTFIISFEHGPSPELSALAVLRDAGIWKAGKLSYSDQRAPEKDWLTLMEAPDFRKQAYEHAVQVVKSVAVVANEDEGSEDDGEDANDNSGVLDRPTRVVRRP